MTDTGVMEHPVLERIDAMVIRADELLNLTTRREIFSANEVLDFALDARIILLDIRNQLEPAG